MSFAQNTCDTLKHLPPLPPPHHLPIIALPLFTVSFATERLRITESQLRAKERDAMLSLQQVRTARTTHAHTYVK